MIDPYFQLGPRPGGDESYHDRTFRCSLAASPVRSMRPEKIREHKSASGHGGPRPNSGGKRAGAGRPRNLQKACQILAIAARNLVSESTARRWLSEHGGSLKYLLKPGVAKILGPEWDDAPLDEQVETYEYLRGIVEKHRAEGWTTR